jgi:hypothetical protein
MSLPVADEKTGIAAWFLVCRDTGNYYDFTVPFTARHHAPRRIIYAGCEQHHDRSADTCTGLKAMRHACAQRFGDWHCAGDGGTETGGITNGVIAGRKSPYPLFFWH